MNADIIQHEDFETARDYQRIAQALTYVDENFQDQPSLTEIADQVGLSEFHFQRLFSRWVGISPKQFLKHLTLECAKRSLGASASVLDVANDAGLSGPGRMHDLFVTCDAVMPGEYKARGEGMTIRYGSHRSPFGDCLLLVTDRGICGLAFTDETEPLPDALAYLSQGWENARIVESAGETQAYVDRMFAPATVGKGADKASQRVLLRGTEFQTRVWRALLTIPPGTLTTPMRISRAASSATPKTPPAPSAAPTLPT